MRLIEIKYIFFISILTLGLNNSPLEHQSSQQESNQRSCSGRTPASSIQNINENKSCENQIYIKQLEENQKSLEKKLNKLEVLADILSKEDKDSDLSLEKEKKKTEEERKSIILKKMRYSEAWLRKDFNRIGLSSSPLPQFKYAKPMDESYSFFGSQHLNKYLYHAITNNYALNDDLNNAWTPQFDPNNGNLLNPQLSPYGAQTSDMIKQVYKPDYTINSSTSNSYPYPSTSSMFAF